MSSTDEHAINPISEHEDHLEKSVRVALAKRILLVSLTVGLLAGLIAYVSFRDRLSDAVISHALERLEQFNTETGHLLDQPDRVAAGEIQRRLEAFTLEQKPSRLGQFMMVEIFGPNGELLAELERESPDLEVMRRLLAEDFGEPATLESASEASRVVRIAGAPHLEVVFLLHNSTGSIVGWGRGIFALAPPIVSDARQQTANLVTALVLAVLATSGMLYPIVVLLVERLSRISSNLLQANLEMLQALGGAMSMRDTDTQAHSARVTLVSVRLAEALGFEAPEIRSLIKGALLHDIGKIAISDTILLKPGPLTDHEYEIMKTHVQHGADIVARSSWLQSGADVVRYHHEKYGGGGYLAGLSSDRIPAAARIFSIADVFDALTSKRPYKEAMTLEESLEELRKGSGAHFEPALVDRFETIAADVYETIIRQTDDQLAELLQSVIDRYFATDLEGLEQS